MAEANPPSQEPVRRKKRSSGGSFIHGTTDVLTSINSNLTSGVNASVNSIMLQMKKTMVQLDEKLEHYEDQADMQLKKTHDRVIKKATHMVLTKMGKTVEASMKPAYLPPSLMPVIEFMFDGTWPEVHKHLEAMILMGSGYDAKEYLQTSRLEHWPGAPAFWGEGGAWRSLPPRPYTWMRAKILYALKPADANKFKHLRDPVALAIVLLKLCPYYGISVLLFVLLFFLIDRSDEGQLVYFVLSFKSFQFISGLSSTAFLCFHFWNCLEESTIDPDLSCVRDAPGQAWSYPFVMLLEVIRIVLLLSAGILLGGGASYGGNEELFALEQVRLQRARGELPSTPRRHSACHSTRQQQQQQQQLGRSSPDGSSERSSPRRVSLRLVAPSESATDGGDSGKGGSEEESDGARPLLTGGSGDASGGSANASGGSAGGAGGQGVRLQPPHPASLRRALAAARLRFGVKRGYGGYVPLLMCYDLMLLLCLCAYLVWHTLWLRRVGAPEWLFWTTCYYCKLAWALASFPYLVFVVPILGQALHQSKATGYDHSGMLVPMLSGDLIKKKKIMDEEEELSRQAQDDPEGEKSAAALKLQKMYRGREGRKVGARVARHFVSLATPVGLFVPADSIEKWFQ